VISFRGFGRAAYIIFRFRRIISVAEMKIYYALSIAFDTCLVAHSEIIHAPKRK
tara:strand:- start:40 stop:201 length:162 start_codon:yes stop_codon:yes gene_type:complete